MDNKAAGIRFAVNVLEDHKSRDPNFSTYTDFENQELNHENRLTSVCSGEGIGVFMLSIYKMLSIAV
ncbi:MAG: hypothetical protein LUQ22_04215 [Methanotrichaceae archaeon]|nr:hypothetical protein [Methanotrichaceae archaeon]